MKIKIDADGILWIERAGVLKEQFCPFDPGDGDDKCVMCGDWCPLFGEPFDGGLTICQGRTLRGEIADERR